MKRIVFYVTACRIDELCVRSTAEVVKFMLILSHFIVLVADTNVKVRKYAYVCAVDAILRFACMHLLADLMSYWCSMWCVSMPAYRLLFVDDYLKYFLLLSCFPDDACLWICPCQFCLCDFNLVLSWYIFTLLACHVPSKCEMSICWCDMRLARINNAYIASDF